MHFSLDKQLKKFYVWADNKKGVIMELKEIWTDPTASECIGCLETTYSAYDDVGFLIPNWTLPEPPIDDVDWEAELYV